MMKLSEAVRKGADWPDVHGPVFRGDCCCAVGGALRAVSIGDRYINDDGHSHEGRMTFERLWRCLGKHFCPHNGCYHPYSRQVKVSVYGAIIHLFEDHRWSKKAISEWIETIERKLGLWDEPKADAPVVQEAIKASVEYAKKL